MENNGPQSRAAIKWVILLLLVIVLVAIWLVINNQPPSAIDNLAAVGQLDGQTFQPKLSVNSQLAGGTVYLTGVDVDSGAWVAIHQDDNGQPGEVLGAGYFDQMVPTGAVDLNQRTVAGNTYYAVLYHDTKADQNFDPFNEQPWLGLDGKPLIIPFQIVDDINSLGEDKG